MAVEKFKNKIEPDEPSEECLRILGMAQDTNFPEKFGRELIPAHPPTIPELSEEARAGWARMAWKEVYIDDGPPQHHEPVVEVDRFLFTRSVYHEQDRGGTWPKLYLRLSTLVKLILIDNELQKLGLRVLVLDGYRSRETQVDLFEEQQRHLQRRYPEFDIEELRLRTQKYVSTPSEHPFRPSPHVTGGAVDWWLADLEGNPVNMGCEFDEFSNVAATRYFEELAKARVLYPEEREALRHRRIHYWASVNAGMANYPEEFWHSSYGDQMWGFNYGQNAFYGPAAFGSPESFLPGAVWVHLRCYGDDGMPRLYYLATPDARSQPCEVMRFTNTVTRALFVADETLEEDRYFTREEVSKIIEEAVGFEPLIIHPRDR